jgi:hypothetical protein
MRITLTSFVVRVSWSDETPDWLALTVQKGLVDHELEGI